MKQNSIHLRGLLFSLGISIFLGSCISPKETNLLQDKKPIYPTKDIEEYKLQVNDEIFCTILTSDTEFAKSFNGLLTSTETMSLTRGGSGGGGGNSTPSYTIFENGCISIPYFEEVEVIGLTTEEAKQKIQHKMRKSFPDAQVIVRLKNNAFYIVSSEKNGTYGVYKDNMTIYQALALSGNVSNSVDLTKVKIVRRSPDGRDIVKTFNLRTESVIESEFYYIKPNDLIYYSTSNSSFFRVGSFTSLVSTIVAPLVFVSTMAALLFK